jgi:hypothetical protein
MVTVIIKLTYFYNVPMVGNLLMRDKLELWSFNDILKYYLIGIVKKTIN